jgi:hypothetical protein
VVDLLFRSDRIFELVSVVRCLDILVVVEDLVVEDLEIICIRSNVKSPREIMGRIITIATKLVPFQPQVDEVNGS